MYLIKKSMIPKYTSICPTKTNKKTIPHIIAMDIPNIAVLSMTIWDIKSRQFISRNKGYARNIPSIIPKDLPLVKQQLTKTKVQSGMDIQYSSCLLQFAYSVK